MTTIAPSGIPPKEAIDQRKESPKRGVGLDVSVIKTYLEQEYPRKDIAFGLKTQNTERSQPIFSTTMTFAISNQYAYLVLCSLEFTESNDKAILVEFF